MGQDFGNVWMTLVPWVGGLASAIALVVLVAVVGDSAVRWWEERARR